MNRNFVLGLLIGSLGVLIVLVLFPLHHSAGADTSRVVQLHEGWNQLVWTGDSQAADTALAPIADKMPIAYGWQGDSQTFSRYVPGNTDVSTMSEVAKDSAYWLLMTQDFSFGVPTDDVQCPTPVVCPQHTPCPQCPPCLIPTPAPASQQACTDARMWAATLESRIHLCEKYDMPCTYEREELASVEAWLNAYCR